MSIAFVKLENIPINSYEGLYIHIKITRDTLTVMLCCIEAQDAKELCELQVYNICEAINVALKMNIPVEFYEV